MQFAHLVAIVFEGGCQHAVEVHAHFFAVHDDAQAIGHVLAFAQGGVRGPVYEGVPFEFVAGGINCEIADVVLSQRGNINRIPTLAVHAGEESSRDEFLVAFGEFDGDAGVEVI